MEQTVSAWCKNILEADTQREPTQMADGSLRTPGAVDFFRILNEEVRGWGGGGEGEAAGATGAAAAAAAAAAACRVLGAGCQCCMVCMCLRPASPRWRTMARASRQ